MKKISLALLAAGILAGPTYWIYAKFFTGTQASLLTLNRVDGDDPVHVWRSPEFTLSHEMAPVGLILSANGHFSPDQAQDKPPKDPYAATLSKDGASATPLNFTLAAGNAADSNPVFREHLLLFQVVQTGHYQLEVKPLSAPVIRLDQVRLEVRQHVVEPDSRVVTAGMVLFILGILGLVLI